MRRDDAEPKSTFAVRIVAADIDRLRAAAERSEEGVTMLSRAIDESKQFMADASPRSVGHLS
ncbi:MAG: hypothetical protein M3063_03695 [Actinomycetota bacterium]|nr:hypothetical protein [Actinomycetota bacterium]